ncbi:MAG: zinc metallopeptidase [Candidatus Aminicenantes bacterium]|nr:zinc metallopeptidase [Candidatus Aminicenantes bacterium]
MLFGGYNTFFLLIPPLVLAIYAQSKVRSTFARYSRVIARSQLTGAQAAGQILQTGGAGEVNVEKVPGQLTDHYDPRKKVLRLSEAVHDSPSIAALGIAAHEAGHALQHRSGYTPLTLRNAIYPIANLGSTLAMPLFIIGFIFTRGPNIWMDLGILLFTGAVAFTVITLPVEFNASKRAMTLLEERKFLSGEELVGARRVLSAAALTYVASTAMAVMQLVRLIILRDSRD